MTDALQEVEVVAAGDEDMGLYLSEIRSFPMLTREQELELARRCAEGSEEAIRAMVSCNLRLVVSEARKYAGRGVPLLDLVQEGSIGLITAAKKFDYTLDFRFSTYATKWIGQRIGRYLKDQGAAIRVPAYTAERIRRLREAEANLHQELGREPGSEELAERTGIPADKARELLALAPEMSSLDLPVGETGGETVAVLLSGSGDLEPQEELIRRELKQVLDSLLLRLNDRQQTILRLHFGMDDGVCRSLEEIGRQLGISKERVRQIERRAMDELQRMGASLGLEDFLE